MDNENKGIETGAAGGTEGGTGAESEGKPVKTFTQDELNAILAKERGKWETKLSEQVEEAKKRAKMTADQKSKYEAEQAEKKLQDRIAEVTKRELMADAKAVLSEKGLPTDLAELLVYSDEDACKESLEKVIKAFSGAVDKQVADKLKASAGAPRKGSSDSAMSGVEAAFYKLNPKLRK